MRVRAHMCGCFDVCVPVVNSHSACVIITFVFVQRRMACDDCFCVSLFVQLYTIFFFDVFPRASALSLVRYNVSIAVHASAACF